MEEEGVQSCIGMAVCQTVCIGVLSNEEIIGVTVNFCLMLGSVNYYNKKNTLYS